MNPNISLPHTTRGNAGVAVAALLAVGPIASIWWVASQTESWGAANVAVAAWVLWFFWTPFAPFTFSAVALGDHRDLAQMHGTTRTWRGVLLLPWMLLSPHSTARFATFANIVGIVVAAWFLLTQLP